MKNDDALGDVPNCLTAKDPYVKLTNNFIRDSL